MLIVVALFDEDDFKVYCLQDAPSRVKDSLSLIIWWQWTNGSVQTCSVWNHNILLLASLHVTENSTEFSSFFSVMTLALLCWKQQT